MINVIVKPLHSCSRHRLRLSELSIEPVLWCYCCPKIAQKLWIVIFQNGQLRWSNDEETLVLAAYYWGGLVSVIGVSWLSRCLGPSRVLLIGTLMNIAGSFATPLAAVSGGPYVLLAVRFVMGIGQVNIELP